MAATDDELRFHREQRRIALARMGASGDATATELDGRRRAAVLYETVITPPVDADYRTPEHFSRTVSPKSRRELADLLTQLRDFRGQLAGLTLGDAQVLYNGDDDAMLLGMEFDRWITAHARARLAKPSPRDDGNPCEKFARLQEEFAVWFEELVLAPGTGHMIPLSRGHKKLAWELYQGTWSRFVLRNEQGLIVGVDPGNPSLERVLGGIVRMNNWHREGLIQVLAREHPGLGVSGEAAGIAAELKTVTHDLVEMCGLLSRSFRPSENVIELTPGIFAGWHWEVGHFAGTINLGTVREDVADQLDSGTSNFSFSLDLEGGARETAMPWLDLGPGVAAWALGVVRPVHAHMLAAWLAAERPSPSVAQASSNEGEAVAVACEILARADVEPDTGGPRLRVPTVRSESLLRLLERSFGVEVKQGKGSEITLFRVGGLKHVLGHHKRNAHVASRRVQVILRALGIGAAEFCAAAGVE